MPAMTLATTSGWRSEKAEGAGDRSRTGGDECVRRGEVITVLGTGEAIGKAGKGVMRRAGVGGGEATEGGDERGIGERGRGLTAADRSASSGEEDVSGTTRVRPSSPIMWSLCLSQHLLQMRLLIETSISVLSCRVKALGEESG